MRHVRTYLAIALLAGVLLGLLSVGLASAESPRLKDYRICGIGLLMQAVSHGTWILQTDQVVPDNSDVVAVKVDTNNCVIVTVYDSSFPLVPSGEFAPIVNWEWHGFAPNTGQWNRIVTTQQHYSNWRGPTGPYSVPVMPTPTKSAK